MNKKLSILIILIFATILSVTAADYNLGYQQIAHDQSIIDLTLTDYDIGEIEIAGQTYSTIDF